jgi:hypothetical protein
VGGVLALGGGIGVILSDLGIVVGVLAGLGLGGLALAGLGVGAGRITSSLSSLNLGLKAGDTVLERAHTAVWIEGLVGIDESVEDYQTPGELIRTIAHELGNLLPIQGVAGSSYQGSDELFQSQYMCSWARPRS